MSGVQQDGQCIEHGQCEVPRNNERFCRGGLSGAVTITGGGGVRQSWVSAKNIDGIPVVSRATTITNTPHCRHVLPCWIKANGRM